MLTRDDILRAAEEVLRRYGPAKANVVDVAHSRQSPRLGFGEVEVALSVETRGPDHSAALISTLRDSGYRVALLADRELLAGVAAVGGGVAGATIAWSRRRAVSLGGVDQVETAERGLLGSVAQVHAGI